MKKRTVCLLTVLTTLVTIAGSWVVYWFLKEKEFEKEVSKAEEKEYEDFEDVYIDLDETDTEDIDMGTDFDLDEEDFEEDITTL